MQTLLTVHSSLEEHHGCWFRCRLKQRVPAAECLSASATAKRKLVCVRTLHPHGARRHALTIALTAMRNRCTVSGWPPARR